MPNVSHVEKALQKAIHYLIESGECDYIGEDVSQLEHALQTADAAMHAKHSTEVTLASLLHDIGHTALTTEQPQMDALGVINHEWIGAKLLLDLGFSKKVALLVGFHVVAKRYLAWKKPNYMDRLSDASKGTLAFQGGPFTDSEAQAFESGELFKEILQVRVNDEKGKVVDAETHSLQFYGDMMRAHLASQGKADNQVTEVILAKPTEAGLSDTNSELILFSADFTSLYAPALQLCYACQAVFPENRLSLIEDDALQDLFIKELVDEAASSMLTRMTLLADEKVLTAFAAVAEHVPDISVIPLETAEHQAIA